MSFDKLDSMFCAFLDLSITQWTIVKAIWKNETISINDIRERYFADNPATNRNSLQATLAKVRRPLALRGIPLKTVYKYGYVMSEDGKEELDRIENIFKRRLGINEKVEEDEDY